MTKIKFRKVVKAVIDLQYREAGFCDATDSLFGDYDTKKASCITMYEADIMKVSFMKFFGKETNDSYFWEQNESKYSSRIGYYREINLARQIGILLWEQWCLDTEEYKLF